MTGIVLTRSERRNRAAAAWLDPEFWGPPGLGCHWCHVRPPLAKVLSFGRGLCEECLSRVLGMEFERMVLWLGKQQETFLRTEKRRAACSAWRRGDDSLVRAYWEEYGVELI